MLNEMGEADCDLLFLLLKCWALEALAAFFEEDDDEETDEDEAEDVDELDNSSPATTAATAACTPALSFSLLAAVAAAAATAAANSPGVFVIVVLRRGGGGVDDLLVVVELAEATWCLSFESSDCRDSEEVDEVDDDDDLAEFWRCLGAAATAVAVALAPGAFVLAFLALAFLGDFVAVGAAGCCCCCCCLSWVGVEEKEDSSAASLWPSVFVRLFSSPNSDWGVVFVAAAVLILVEGVWGCVGCWWRRWGALEFGAKYVCTNIKKNTNLKKC